MHSACMVWLWLGAWLLPGESTIVYPCLAALSLTESSLSLTGVAIQWGHIPLRMPYKCLGYVTMYLFQTPDWSCLGSLFGRKRTIKGPDNPTCQFLPIMSNKCCSGTGKEGKTKEVVKDRVVKKSCVGQSCM